MRPDNSEKYNAEIELSSGTPNQIHLFCPTGRVMNRMKGAGDGHYIRNSDYTRGQSNVYVNGYKENVEIYSGGPFIWRRIVFWAYEAVPRAVQMRQSGGTSEWYYTRNLRPFENSEDFREWLFGATQGIDYTKSTLHMTPVNRQRIKVVMDKTYHMNAQSDSTPRLRVFKHYFKGGKIIYDDKEVGSYPIESDNTAFSISSRMSMGNMYICDIFSNPFGTTGGSSAFSAQGRLYWSES